MELTLDGHRTLHMSGTCSNPPPEGLLSPCEPTDQSSERAVISWSLREGQCQDPNPDLTASCSVLGTNREEGSGPQKGQGPRHW